jgi:NADP-dependent aldehyde dehydrogenase
VTSEKEKEMTPYLIVGRGSVERSETFRAYAPASGKTIDPSFSIATLQDVADACALADEAFDSFRETSPDERARFLETIAERIDDLGDAIVQRAMVESGLPEARLTGCCVRGAGRM